MYNIWYNIWNIIVQYSDVEGGFEGTGNIDEVPNFLDEEDYFLNPLSSPCIDAGNPENCYNDIEDPLNLGNPLPPSLGTLINDMGAYGGDPYQTIETAGYSSQFQAF